MLKNKPILGVIHDYDRRILCFFQEDNLKIQLNFSLESEKGQTYAVYQLNWPTQCVALPDIIIFSERSEIYFNF